MSEPAQRRAPVCGTCRRCGCALSYVASFRDGAWYCCGDCAGSDRCTCGCKPELARPRSADAYVPARRMFGARQPDGLNLREPDRQRAFPFADRWRGR